MGKDLVDKSYLSSLVPAGSVVAVAVSGGRDSVALLHFLKSVSAELSIEVRAVNVEHGIRGEESVRDSEFVKSLCKSWDIPLLSKSVDAPQLKKSEGLTTEEAARILRYEVFAEAISDGFATVVATAHHKSDDAETLLLRILRGTGLRGLTGISEKSNGVVRPLLKTSSEEIDAYVSEHSLPFVTDSTNFSDEADRNFLRNVVLPLLKTRYPKVEDSLLRLSENAKEAEAFLDKCAPEPKLDGESVLIEKTDDKVILRLAFEKAFRALGVYSDVEMRHYRLLENLFSAEVGKELDMPHGVRAVKERGAVRLYFPKELWSGELPFSEGVTETPVGKATVFLKEDGDKIYFDAGKIPAGSVFRTRRAGDFIKKFGGGQKSLQDFLTDKKIPAYLKDRILLVAKGNEVFAVCGVDVSRAVAVDDKTQRVLAINVK